MMALWFLLITFSPNCIKADEFVSTKTDYEVRKAYKLIYNNCPEVAYRIPCFLPIKEFKGVRFSSGFGDRLHPIEGIVKHHNGIDIASDVKPVIATASGYIKRTGFDKSLGNFIIIDHGNTYETTYAHLSKIIVFENKKVSLGDEIGMIGSTGNATGNHIHYEIRKKGVILNPIHYLLLFYYASN